MSIRQAIIFGSVLFLGACKYNVADPKACYSPNVEQLIITNCTGSGCHNSKDHEHHVDLSSYEKIMQYVKPGHAQQSELYTVLHNSMPPKKKLSSIEIQTIKNWIDLGAHQNNCASMSCDTSNFAFSTSVEPMILAYCSGCHLPSSSNGIVLTDYATITAAINKGRVLGSINHTAGYSAMPQNMNKLSDCQITIIEKWVAAGMPQN